MKKQSGLSRRQFLRAAGLGTGVGAILSSGIAPMIWTRQASAAPLNNLALSGGAIFFVLQGGARTQAVFNGTVSSGANPFGSLSGLTVPLSKMVKDTGLDDLAINQHLNLVTTCQHHNRSGNHEPARIVACTGYEDNENKPGILTAINYSFGFRSIPCVNLGDDTPTTRVGSEISSTFTPIKLASALNVKDIVDAVATDPARRVELKRIGRLRSGLSDRFHRSTRYSEPEDIPFFQRKAAGVASQLDDPALDIRSDASLGQYVDETPVANAGLRAAFGVSPAGKGNIEGANAMLALRLRQLGVAGITIASEQSWDLHDNEETRLESRAKDLGKALAGLIDQLSRIPDSVVSGLTLLDTTVITILTDFNRGNWGNNSGFNDDHGSDHRADEDKTALQCIPIIGGGLPGGKVLGQIGSNGSALGSSPIYETRQILATVLDLLGIPPGNFLPGINPLTQELIG